LKCAKKAGENSQKFSWDQKASTLRKTSVSCKSGIKSIKRFRIQSILEMGVKNIY